MALKVVTTVYQQVADISGFNQQHLWLFVLRIWSERQKERIQCQEVCPLAKSFIKYWLTQISQRNIHPLMMMVSCSSHFC